VAAATAGRGANSIGAVEAEPTKHAEIQCAATSGRGYTGRGLDFADLATLARDIHDCRRCPLGFSRTHAVPGVGPESARIMVVGEAPGQNEDQQGEPFVGAAGKLLDQLLKGIGLSRGDVFITNILKCRPPNNRDPQPAEVQACSPYLEQQLRLIKPEVVLILGRHALARTGRVRPEVVVVPLEKVQSIRLRQGPLQRWLRLATVHIDTAGRGWQARAVCRDELEADTLLWRLTDLAREARGRRR